jgi:hypothetical protein
VNFTQREGRFMRNSRVLGILVGALSAMAAVCPTPASAASAPSTLMARQSDFDARALVASGGSSVSGFSLTHPGRFSMQQSYSISAMSGSMGSASSGLYLNTVGYKLSDPLLLFVDVGIHTPLHSSIQGMNGAAGAAGAAGSSLVVPRLGLEYKPTERLTVNLELVNGADAWKAYGPGWGFGRSSFYGSRFP